MFKKPVTIVEWEFIWQTSVNIYNEYGEIVQIIAGKMVYDERHIPPNDFLDFINVDSCNILVDTKEEVEFTPKQSTRNPPDQKTPSGIKKLNL